MLPPFQMVVLLTPFSNSELDTTNATTSEGKMKLGGGAELYITVDENVHLGP